jgi:hypothetical protein
MSAVEQRVIFCYSKGVASYRKYRSAYFPPGTPQPVVLEGVVSLARRCVPCLTRLTTLRGSLDQDSSRPSGNC